MKYREAIIIILLITVIVACSTARKSVDRREAVTQTLTDTADSCSLHATVQESTSTEEEYWLVIEAEFDSIRCGEASEPETELQRTLRDMRKTGARRVIIGRGKKESQTVSSTEDTTRVTKKHGEQSTTDLRTTEKQRKGKAGWKHVAIYLALMLVLTGMIVGTRKIINS